MRIYLHIGYPKTASTWLYKKFFPFLENYSVVHRRDIADELIKPYALDFNPEKCRNFFLNKYGDKLIISLPGFVGTTHNFGLNGYLTKEHAHRLHDVFPTAKVILFIRRQQDIIASTYYQYIVAGGTYSINTYLKKQNEGELRKATSFSLKHFEYDLTIKLYENLFSNENVHVYLYEELQNDLKQFILRFRDEHDFHFNMENIDPRRETQRFRIGIILLSKVANIFTSMKLSNKYYLINIPFWFHFFKPKIKKLNRYRIFGKRSDTMQILGTRNYNHITAYYKKSNWTLINEFGLKDIQTYNYPL